MANWGCIENNERKKNFVELVDNRKSFTILNLLERRVANSSIIVTDGHPSYSSAVCEFGAIHKVIYHSIGFITQDRTNTNLTENLWSHLKQEYRARGGINKGKMQFFLNEFEWKKKSSKTGKKRL
jgi:transposase-like protein